MNPQFEPDRNRLWVTAAQQLVLLWMEIIQVTKFEVASSTAVTRTWRVFQLQDCAVLGEGSPDSWPWRLAYRLVVL